MARLEIDAKLVSDALDSLRRKNGDDQAFRADLFKTRRQWRIDRGQPKLAIEVHGPRRDYDYSMFCCDHNVEAEECAAEWSADLIDDLEAGEDAALRFVVRSWLPDDVCAACEATPGVQ